MSIHEVNEQIRAWNQMGEFCAAQAQKLEQAGWDSFEDHAGMSGERPIAAIQIARPDLEAAWQEQHEQAAAPEQQPHPEPAPAPNAEETLAVSVEEVRGVLAEVSVAGFTAQARALIQQTGVSKLSEVPPEQYGWLLGKAKELRDASK